ncbi:hypothetical protein N7462_010255 [Penicillium macrosclerotiorum]|uniref:uncharacterized protein n=1 Tax=Penicillium macrosclerotiorum TaxID=303699 RepID=UPI0025488802|nr:uncharacterized protein N7462_010255 [Penicillium macrosclerotiorum]KAJ5669185.1 hypothetical protein N7462_010255 [Penicillium macrosclerotiorum]
MALRCPRTGGRRPDIRDESSRPRKLFALLLYARPPPPPSTHLLYTEYRGVNPGVSPPQKMSEVLTRSSGHYAILQQERVRIGGTEEQTMEHPRTPEQRLGFAPGWMGVVPVAIAGWPLGKCPHLLRYGRKSPSEKTAGRVSPPSPPVRSAACSCSQLLPALA